MKFVELRDNCQEHLLLARKQIIFLPVSMGLLISKLQNKFKTDKFKNKIDRTSSVNHPKHNQLIGVIP